jgi:Glutathione S-transferase, N-terminal domain
MGMLVDGTWFDDDPLPADRGGAFLRPDSSFRDRVSRDNDSRFKAERGRYQLVTAPSCPWAHRTVLMRAFKGLDGAVPLLESDLPKGQGWAYSRGFDDLAPKNGVFHVHQVYSAARPDYTGRATVPVLWDRKTRGPGSSGTESSIQRITRVCRTAPDPKADLMVPRKRGAILSRFHSAGETVALPDLAARCAQWILAEAPRSRAERSRRGRLRGLWRLTCATQTANAAPRGTR